MIRHVVASSVEAETSDILHNVQVAIPLTYMLNKMVHPHVSTPLKSDNATANSFIHGNITQKKPK